MQPQHRRRSRALVALYLAAVVVLVLAFVELARSGAGRSPWGLAALAAIEVLGIAIALRWYTHELAGET